MRDPTAANNDKNLSVLVEVHFPPQEDSIVYSNPTVKTKFVGEWESKLENISDNKECLLLLVSPPGAGKTHLVETVIMAKAEANGRHTQRIDCSNDELVELSLTYILNRKFPRDTKALLVADEFHMLDVYAKEELLRWCTERQHWLQVILIANRSDENDQKLLSSARRQYSTPDAVQLLNCRLRIDKVLAIYEKECPLPRYETYIAIFFRACRTLFGDDSISLRNIPPIHELLVPDGNPPRHKLAALLLSKLPHIGAYCAKHFVNHVDAISKQYGNCMEQLVGRLPQTSSPLHMLVHVALLDDQGTLCSYKEFTSRLENAHKAHPVTRLAAWVQYMCRSVNIEQPPLDCLNQLECIDQVGFPLIASESGSMGLHSCLSFYKSGDYTDLEWMAEAIVHGHAMNWSQVRECWQSHFISDSCGFSHLLSVCTDPSSVLMALSPKNLCLLVNASEILLSQLVLDNYTPDELTLDSDESPYFVAAWFLIRNTPKLCGYYTDSWQEHLRKTDVFSVMKWASEYAFHLLDVVDDPEGRQHYIQDLLVRVTTEKSAEARRSKDVMNEIISLWSNIFAPLLVIGNNTSSNNSQQQQQGIPYDIGYSIAKSQHPPKNGWPPFVRMLCNLAHGAADPTEVDSLYNHPFFTEYHGPQQSALFIPNEILDTFLSLEGGGLSKRWQVSILTSPLISIPDEFNTLKHKKNLMEGLKSLESRDALKVGGSLRQVLLDMYDHMYPQQD